MEIKRKLLNKILTAQLKKEKSLWERGLIFLYKFYKIVKLQLKNKGHSSYLLFKYIERKVFRDDFNYITFAQALGWLEDWIKKFPNSYDLIVGIPRSGLFFANFIALKLGKPLSTPDLDKIWVSGNEGFFIKKEEKQFEHILLLDDSITSGNTFQKALRTLKNSLPKRTKITTAALIASEDTKDKVDMFYVVVPRPRLFEWNILHSKKGRVIAVDLDGVICEEPPVSLRVNESKYKEWLKKAKPYLIPSFEIDYIISNRLEEFRETTEEWLKRYRVKYRQLILRKFLPVWGERKADFKIKKLLEIKPDFFWESSPQEAQQIWRETRIPTFSIKENKLLS